MSQRFVEIEIDGKTRLLRFDFNAVSELEERLGRGILSVLTQEQIGFNMTRTLYWTGLKWKERGLTVERTGQMLQKEIENGKSLNELMEPVVDALIKSGLLGQVNEEAEDEDPNESPA